MNLLIFQFIVGEKAQKNELWIEYTMYVCFKLLRK